jgi:hypothetical protein
MQKRQSPLSRGGLRGLKNVALAETIAVLAKKVKRRVFRWRLARLERLGPCAPGGPRPFDLGLSLKIDVARQRLESLGGAT